MAEAKSKYIMKVWNGKYGSGAQFVVQDTTNGKFALFSPARPKDITWVDTDLTKDADYKGWESFEDEPVDDLTQVVM